MTHIAKLHEVKTDITEWINRQFNNNGRFQRLTFNNG